MTSRRINDRSVRGDEPRDLASPVFRQRSSLGEYSTPELDRPSEVTGAREAGHGRDCEIASRVRVVSGNSERDTRQRLASVAVERPRGGRIAASFGPLRLESVHLGLPDARVTHPRVH
jgi:hypothetical protein